MKAYCISDYPDSEAEYDTSDKRKYIMQLYEDNTVGYFGIDGDKFENKYTGSKVIAQQSDDESVEEFKEKNNINLSANEYGSLEANDRKCNDDDFSVRCDMAEAKYGLSKLIHDSDPIVREFVAKVGYGLDILVKDPDFRVRIAVVKQKYGLESLINDSNISVRVEVAKQGYGLEKLVHDPDYHVRKVVAEKGFGLSILANDKQKIVRDIAISKLCDI